MFLKYFLIAFQLLISIALFTFTGIAFKHNSIGQNIINICTSLIPLFRFQNIIAYYRIFLNQPYLQAISTLFMSISLSLGTLLEKYHPTSSQQFAKFNRFSLIFTIVVLSINLSYYLVLMLTIYFHMCRQLYKLARGTILTSSATLLQQQLQILRSSFRTYRELAEGDILISQECSICLSNFEDQQICVVLPGCGHCFHSECIDDWLNNKSNCPNCRSNIRLGLLRNEY